jgi:hypothetical protein
MDRAWCLLRKKRLEIDYEAAALEAGLDLPPLTNRITDLLFSDDDVDEIYGLAGSPLNSDPVPKADPVPRRLGAEKAREIIESP